MEVIHTTNKRICNTINRNGCYITENDDMYYYKNNLLHRAGGLPAVEYSNGDKRWYRKGFIHRIGGPAVEYSDGKSWYLFGIDYSEEEYNKLVSNIPLLYWVHRLAFICRVS